MGTVSKRCLKFCKLTVDKINRFAHNAYIAYSAYIVYISHIGLRCVFYNNPLSCSILT